MSPRSQSGRPGGGKYGQRSCPALGRVITPSDCGAQRGSKLDCPDHCPFFPFGRAGGDLWLKVDESWTAKAIGYAARHLAPAQVQELVKRLTIPMSDQRVERECAAQNALHTALFLQPHPPGKTLVEKWESENWAGLTNDEQVMMRYRRHVRPTVIEVQRVLDPQSVECVDALAPESGRFLLVDRGVATQMVRFSRVFTWLVRYPHFCRASANATEIPHTIWAEWRRAIDERYQRARGGRPDLALKDFLAETIVESTALITSLSLEYRERVFATLDFHHCVAVLGYSCPRAEIERVLEGKPEFILDNAPGQASGPPPLATYTWVRRGESAAFGQDESEATGVRSDSSDEGAGVLARVRIYEGRLVVEALSRRKHAFVREMLARYFGALVTLEQESIRDLATMLADRKRRELALASAQRRAYGQRSQRPPPATPGSAAGGDDPSASVSPEARRQALAEQHLQRYRGFLDESMPALGGLTPRAAATDPERRPQLIELLKQHLHDLEQVNREEGLDLNIGWLLEELGLREIL